MAISECRGAINIIIGLGQILVSPCFKLFNAEKLYVSHMEAGKTAIKQGLKDLTPCIILTATVVTSVKVWSLIQD